MPSVWATFSVFHSTLYLLCLSRVTAFFSGVLGGCWTYCDFLQLACHQCLLPPGPHSLPVVLYIWFFYGLVHSLHHIHYFPHCHTTYAHTVYTYLGCSAPALYCTRSVAPLLGQTTVSGRVRTPIVTPCCTAKTVAIPFPSCILPSHSFHFGGDQPVRSAEPSLFVTFAVGWMLPFVDLAVA